MKYKAAIAAVLIILGITLYRAFISSGPHEVTMILINGNVYTGDGSRAEAVAVDGSRIAGVGTTQEIVRQFRSHTVVDLHGQTMVPGFIDAHAHLEGFGAALLNLDVAGLGSVAEIQDSIRQHVRRVPEGGWLRGRGWDQNRWTTRQFPSAKDIDVVSGNVPVYLVRIDGHAIWVNSRAMQMAGVSASTRDPEGGRIIRGRNGEPTGVFIDNAMDLIPIPSPTRAERIAAVDTAVQECLKVGLTEVHDMGVDAEGIEIYKELIRLGKFPFRVYAAIGGPGELWQQYLKNGPEVGNHRLTVRAIKLYADGALGSRGAALIEPYSDEPTTRGLTLMSSSDIERISEQALDHGFQVCTHAIGDRANHIVLDSYEKAFNLKHINGKTVRFRVVHAQVLAPDDIPRFGNLGILPSMQPTHCTSDMPWAESRLGTVRVKGAYAWRSLIDDGSIIPGGSDVPVESPNPLWGFYAAITRQDHDGNPPGGWHSEQRMTREEALRSFTSWAAYASFEDSIKGTIVPGKLADLVVLSDDIMTIAPAKILDTHVELTIVGGTVVFRREK